MQRIHGLKVKQYRSQMLYAQHSCAGWAPICVLLGLGLWLGAMVGATGYYPLQPTLLLALGSLGSFALVPLALSTGSWLAVDRHRGWIHWRESRCLRGRRESFSPQRIEALRIGRLLPGFWRIELQLDHPRIGRVALGWTMGVKRARALARQWAAILEVDWTDERELLHVARAVVDDAGAPSPTETHPFEWPHQLPPPPEIHVETVGGVTRFVFPNTIEAALGSAAALFYSVLWCLWSWSSLIFNWEATTAPLERWTRPEIWTMALLGGGSVIGLILLGRALALITGRQILECDSQGWRLGIQWLGRCWGRRPLEWPRRGWLRRVDLPSLDSGLWLLGRRRDCCLAPGLSSEALSWLQQVLSRAG